MSPIAVDNNEASFTLHGAGPVASTAYTVPSTSAHVKWIDAPLIGLAPTSPVTLDVGMSVICAFDNIAKSSTEPKSTFIAVKATTACDMKRTNKNELKISFRY
jgi:hypothetical protein